MKLSELRKKLREKKEPESFSGVDLVKEKVDSGEIDIATERLRALAEGRRAALAEIGRKAKAFPFPVLQPFRAPIGTRWDDDEVAASSLSMEAVRKAMVGDV